MKVVRKILLAVSIAIALFTFVFSLYFFAATKNVTLQKEKLLLPNAQFFIYDKTGKRINHDYCFETRDIVAIEQLPKHVKDAFVCTEDKRFFSHNGFDYIRIGKALLKNLRSFSFREGASTISQQLVKNTHLSLEKTVARKLQEFKLTSILERDYGKNEILQMYLNTIYFGHSCYGIASASEFYFQKPAEKLTISEAATLAGLIRSPNNYSPFKNPAVCKKRRNVVLGLMLQQNVITHQEYEAAVQDAVPDTPQKRSRNFSYTQCVLEELEQISQTHSFPLTEKVEIFTYFDEDAQTALESFSTQTPYDKTFAIIDNDTHGYKAYYSTVGNIRRSPGSLIKPLLVYAPALEKGLLSPATPILDEKINIAGYAPQNYGNKYHGYVSAREALSQSLNIPAVKTLNALHVDTAAIYAKKLNLPLHEEDKTLALALGGMRDGLTFQELLSAYTVFSCDGQFSPSSFIKKVALNGKIVYEKGREQHYVFSPETAYLTTDMLRSAIQDGTAKRLRTLSFPVAAKTGTVGTKHGNIDAYTIAYTPSETVGVWLGNRDNTIINETGGRMPAEIVKNILESIHGSHKHDFSCGDFEQPNDVISLEIDKISYEQSHKIMLADSIAAAKYKKIELFNRQFSPNEQSTIFSRPTLSNPTLHYANGCIKISFFSKPYDFYHYTIERIEGNSVECIYQGKASQEFVDKDVKKDKLYAYRITPYFQGNIGTTFTTPTILTESPPPILDKPWWNY